jgi:hypothetical protein
LPCGGPSFCFPGIALVVATKGSEGAELLSAAKDIIYYVPGVVVWKGRRITTTDLLLSIYSVVAGRRVVGDAELNPPSEPEYVL